MGTAPTSNSTTTTYIPPNIMLMKKKLDLTLEMKTYSFKLSTNIQHHLLLLLNPDRDY